MTEYVTSLSDNDKEVKSLCSKTPEITTIPALADREHMARPYPGGGYDMLLINVPTSFEQGVIPDGEEPPHGLLRVASSAKAKGWNMGFLDAHHLKLSPEEIRNQIIRINPRSVGVNPTSVNVNEVEPIIKACRELSIPYVLGGVHATLDPKIARQDFPDAIAIVRGNGEIAIDEVLSVLFNNAPKSNNKGIYYYDHAIGERTDYAQKLNPGEIPMVDQRELVEEPVYIHEVQINGKKRIISEATLFTTDGCPFDCTMCSSPIMVGWGVRGMVPYSRPSMGRIVQEMSYCVNELGADAIHFLDDMVFVNQNHVEQLYAEMATTDLIDKVIWRGMTRSPIIDKFDDSTMKQLVKTGVWKIALGIESGDEAILRQIHKKVNPDQVGRAVEKLAKYGIQVKGFFIIGFPGETEEQIQATYDLIMGLKNLGMTEASVFQFKPYPGTVKYTRLVRENGGILSNLAYLRKTNSGHDGKIQERLENAAWLPDDMIIAAVPSKRVREWVIRSLNDFYGEKPQL
jgi:anaerobic magnesium-protoporphyrin IX monomethyl ester cyclase